MQQRSYSLAGKSISFNAYFTKNVFLTHSRHVILPKEIAKKVPKRLMTEAEWRGLGVQMSQGWENYMRHAPGKSFNFILKHEVNFSSYIKILRSVGF